MRNWFDWFRPSKENRQMWRMSVPVTSKTMPVILYWERLLARVAHLHGVVVECGVGGGNSLIIIGALLKAMGSRQRLIGYDSFVGLPTPTIEDANPKHGEGFLAFPQDYVERLLLSQLGERHGVTLKAGPFTETLQCVPWPIALAHLDCDLYGSYATCLTLLTPHLLPGAIVAVDEYLEESVAWPGAVKAIDAHCEAQGWTVEMDPQTRKHFIVVPGPELTRSAAMI